MPGSSAVARPRRKLGKRIVVTVSRDEWDRLAARAAAEERDPWQQARWLLVRALRETETQPSEIEDSAELAQAI
jgi:hypothetical protein